MKRFILSLLVLGSIAVAGPSLAYASEVTGQLTSSGSTVPTPDSDDDNSSSGGGGSSSGSISGTVTGGSSGGSGGTSGTGGTNGGVVAGTFAPGGTAPAFGGELTDGAGFLPDEVVALSEGDAVAFANEGSAANQPNDSLLAAAFASGFGTGWWLWILVLLLVLAGIYVYRRYYTKKGS